MKPLTCEWVEKAEGHFVTAQRGMRAVKAPNYDAAGLHSRQCVENYLKAHLQESSTYFPKTHDLHELLHLLMAIDANWSAFQMPCRVLAAYTIDSCLPGDFATRKVALQALRLCRAVRTNARHGFGLAEQQKPQRKPEMFLAASGS